MAKAVALFSGGLDSSLAILVVMRQGIEVTAITFLNHFGCNIGDRSSCSNDPFPIAEKFGFQVKLCHLSDKFFEIVKNPKFGHGKNLNPCIDCRIMMLREAKELMELIGADFLITGEVLGQRPMSQRRDTFPVIDMEAGVEGYVLRPLSAKLLKKTIPEERGIVNRDSLYDFSGRSRKPQMALAIELGLTDYAPPAGGCLLTEPNYSHRLKDLLTHKPNPDFRDIELLRVGRHFRFSNDCKIIVGRNKNENEMLLSLSKPEDHILKVEGFGSPVTLVTGMFTNEALSMAASFCARYSDAKYMPYVDVTCFNGNKRFIVKTQPAREDVIEHYRIEKKHLKMWRLNLHRFRSAQEPLLT